MLSYGEFIFETLNTITLAEDIDGKQNICVCLNNKFYTVYVEHDYYKEEEEMRYDYKNIKWYLLYAQYVTEFAEQMLEDIHKKRLEEFIEKYENILTLQIPHWISIYTDRGKITSPWLMDAKNELIYMKNHKDYWLWDYMRKMYLELQHK